MASKGLDPRVRNIRIKTGVVRRYEMYTHIVSFPDLLQGGLGNETNTHTHSRTHTLHTCTHTCIHTHKRILHTPHTHIVSLGRPSERALLGISEIQGDERERERGSADSEQDSIGSAGMLAEPIRLQQSCDSLLIR